MESEVGRKCNGKLGSRSGHVVAFSSAIEARKLGESSCNAYATKRITIKTSADLAVLQCSTMYVAVTQYGAIQDKRANAEQR